MGKITLKRKTYGLVDLAKGAGGGYLLYDAFKNGKDQPLLNRLLKSGLGIGLLSNALKGNKPGSGKPNLASILGTLAIGGVIYNRLKNNMKPSDSTTPTPAVDDQSATVKVEEPKALPEPEKKEDQKPTIVVPEIKEEAKPNLPTNDQSLEDLKALSGLDKKEDSKSTIALPEINNKEEVKPGLSDDNIKAIVSMDEGKEKAFSIRLPRRKKY